VGDWQPIETAPKDGTPVLLWDPDGVCRAEEARWSPNGRPGGEFGPFVWLMGNDDRVAERVPTHWRRPLTESP
jgi:hypothetical protein